MRRWLGILLLLFLMPMLAFGQGTPGVYIQQTPSMLQAATAVGTSNASTGTITLTPGSGNFVYITAIEVTNCNGTGAISPATPTFITATNLTGVPAWSVGSGAAAGLCQPTINQTFSTGLKSIASGTAVVFTMPTFVSNQIVRLNVYWYSAP